MAISFIDEHTAEFYVIPAMKRILDNEFNFMAPIYPWLTRELRSISKNVHSEDNFQILILFPRKLKLSTDDEIFVTMNFEVDIFGGRGIDIKYLLLLNVHMLIIFWS